MKIGFVIPVMSDVDLEAIANNIKSACSDCKANYEIIFAVNNKNIEMFQKVREVFVENSKIRSFRTDRNVDEHKLITLGLGMCEKYDATIVYSAKEELNPDVVKAFINSWQAGNKIVYLKKMYSGFKKAWSSIKNMFYRLGMKMIGVFRDGLAENDIQLLDGDVIKTLNQLPGKGQQLRTLDSFVGYMTDTIYMEVDNKSKVNPTYVEKSKGYKKNAAVEYSMLIIALMCAVFSIVALCVLEIPVFLHIILWGLFVVCSVISLCFYTRKRLLYRAGKNTDGSEYAVMNENLEKYNM